MIIMFWCGWEIADKSYRPARIQVGFVSAEYDDQIFARVLSGIFQPGKQMIKSFSPCDVVNQQGPSCSSLKMTATISANVIANQKIRT